MVWRGGRGAASEDGGRGADGCSDGGAGGRSG